MQEEIILVVESQRASLDLDLDLDLRSWVLRTSETRPAMLCVQPVLVKRHFTEVPPFLGLGSQQVIASGKRLSIEVKLAKLLG